MFLSKLTVRTRIYSLVAMFSLAFVAYAAWSYSTLRVARVHGPYYERIVQGKDLIADILPPPNYIIESYLMALHMDNEVDQDVSAETLQGYIERCKFLETEFDQRHAFWIDDLPEGEMKKIKTVDCYEPAVEFYGILNEQFIPACRAGDKETVSRLVRNDLRLAYEEHRAAVDKVVTMAMDSNAAQEAEVGALIHSRSTWSVIVSILVLAGVAFGGWFTASRTVGPLLRSANALKDLSINGLGSVSRRLSANAESTVDQAQMASGAAEQVSSNARSLSDAVEQFEISIREIAGNASTAASVARDAVEATERTNSTITRLGESSSEIGNVIKVINSIAEQTNLLALNATIEAARAGEAGKGFAVVANEVKELAKETSKATEEIIGRIGAIQTDTVEAVNAIAEVSQIITNINESQNAIAGAVEEQTAMTSEISRNIADVASGSGEIAKSISYVAEAARSTTGGSEETLERAADLDALAVDLLSLVGQARAATTPRSSTEPRNVASTGSKGKYQLQD